MTKQPSPAVHHLQQALQFLDALGAQIQDVDAARMNVGYYGLLVPIHERHYLPFEKLRLERRREFKNEDAYIESLKAKINEDRARQLATINDCMAIIRELLQELERSEKRRL